MPPSTPGFYPPEFTERSRSVLGRVHEAVPDAVLIGDWGTWVRTGGPMSHDIDLIVTHPQLAALTALVDEMSDSRHLAGRKWRGTLEGIHLDLYVPHQSRLAPRAAHRTARAAHRGPRRLGGAGAAGASRHQAGGAGRPARLRARRQGPPRDHGVGQPRRGHRGGGWRPARRVGSSARSGHPAHRPGVRVPRRPSPRPQPAANPQPARQRLARAFAPTGARHSIAAGAGRTGPRPAWTRPLTPGRAQDHTQDQTPAAATGAHGADRSTHSVRVSGRATTSRTAR